MIAMKFFSKLASGSSRRPVSPGKMQHSGRRIVTPKASVHPDMSSAKMMRLKKAHLLNACEEYGLTTSGTKHDLVATLRDHFSASTMADPGASLVSEAQADMDLVQDLTDKVSLLDQAIQTKTDELQSMHEGDRVLMAEVINEMADLKVSWKRKLSEVSAVLEEVVALRQAQTEFSTLQQQQVELREELEVLSRMLKLREAETQTLQDQLDQVRQEQSSEKASMQTERLAVLALASQVASAQSVQEVGSDRTFSDPWVPSTYGFHSSSMTPASPMSIKKMLSVSPDLMSMTNATDGNRVLGAALPGLLAINATSQVLGKYCKLRDSLFTTTVQARASDAACAGIFCLLATVMS
eukprot:jgi/Ulvmu1/5105/UM021_0122.1